MSTNIPIDDSKQQEHDDPHEMGLVGDPATTLAEADKLRGKQGCERLLAQLLTRAGRQAYRALNWDLAIQCFQEAYTVEEAHGGDPELRAQLANVIGRVFQQSVASFNNSQTGIERCTITKRRGKLLRLLLAPNMPTQLMP
jgi:hypothetical protein